MILGTYPTTVLLRLQRRCGSTRKEYQETLRTAASNYRHGTTGAFPAAHIAARAAQQWAKAKHHNALVPCDAAAHCGARSNHQSAVYAA